MTIFKIMPYVRKIKRRTYKPFRGGKTRFGGPRKSSEGMSAWANIYSAGSGSKYSWIASRPQAQGWSNYTTSNPFKPRMFVKHNYTELVDLSSTTAGAFGTEKVWRLNDLFDPDFSIGGHQPYGRDTLASIYSRYKVYAVKVNVIFTNPSQDGSACGIQLSPPTQTSTLQGKTISEAAEKQNVRIKYLNGTGSQVVSFNFYMPMEQLIQCTKLQYKADMTDFSASSGESPTFTPFIRIATANSTGTSGVTTQCQIKLTYYAMWYDRLQLSQS